MRMVMLRRVKIYVKSPRGRYIFANWQSIKHRLPVGLSDARRYLTFPLSLPAARRVTATDFRKMEPRALGCWT
jgi:hypothetical protein